MSEPVRVAVAVEEPTDVVVIKAIVHRLLGKSDFELQVLQPETSSAFGATAEGFVAVQYRIRTDHW